MVVLVVIIVTVVFIAVVVVVVVVLVGKSARNSVEFRNYSSSGPFELQNFHRNFIFMIVKCVPANLEHILAGLESSPAIDSYNFIFHESENFPAFYFFGPLLSHLLILSRCNNGGNCFE